MKKKWQKMLIPFIAVLVIFAVLYNTREGFESDEKLAAVGLQFTGPLSTIYNTFKDHPQFPQYAKLMFTNPTEVILPFFKKHPTFKYSIIKVSTREIFYNPIAEYEKTGKMSPFPTTTNSDEYIIYSNLFNLPITKKESEEFYPNMGGSFLSNCTPQSIRTNTESLISKWKPEILKMERKYSIYEYNNNIWRIIQSVMNNTFDSDISSISLENLKLSMSSTYSSINSDSNKEDTFNSFKDEERKAAFTVLKKELVASGYTDFSNNVLLTPTQKENGYKALIAYLKETKSYKNALISIEDEKDTGRVEIMRDTKSVADAFTVFFAVLEGVIWNSTIYEPCVAISGFQNKEGFSEEVDLTKLKDYKGDIIFSAKRPAAAPAAAIPAAPKEGLSNTAITLIALGGVTVIGGGVFLAVRSSSSV